MPSSPALPSPQPYPRTRPSPAPPRLRRRLLTLTGLGLAGLVAGLLSGCSGSTAPAVADPIAPSFAQLAGNWGFAVPRTASPGATELTSLGGSLAVSGSEVTGTLHPLTSGQCLASTDVISISGSIDANAQLTLTGVSGTGVAVRIVGTVAADRRSLENPTITVSGGACATPAALHTAAGATIAHDNTGATAQQYQPVSGVYTGTLLTAEGESFTLTTTVTQLDQPDASGIYHLQGTAASPGNTCLPASVTATASAVSGGSLVATYTDSTGATSITATGSASSDGSTVTFTNWALTSPCGSDSGTGALTRH